MTYLSTGIQRIPLRKQPIHPTISSNNEFPITMTNEPRNLGHAIRSLRESASLTPGDVAQRLQLDRATLLGYESGELELPAQVLMAYLQAIDRSLVDLHLSLNPEQPPSPRVVALLTELRGLQPTA
jgi:DNA-binding XRE family transcriptional regulator